MKRIILTGVTVLILALPAAGWNGKDDAFAQNDNKNRAYDIQLGTRPFSLVRDMNQGPLKEKLERCEKGPFKRTDFSIGHRGAPMQFPEHTLESYEAAVRMGAGIVECDVTFTRDKELVCRHSQCDLHTTTNILETPLAGKCSVPFQPAVFDADGNLITPATAQCCTSDITLAEFKSLKGKMDTANPRATRVAEYMQGTADCKTDICTTRGTVLTHRESIALFQKLGVKMMPELKSPSVPMPFDGFSQADYAQKLIDEYKGAGISIKNVWVQSFNLDDVMYWIRHEPDFGRQAVYLDGRYDDLAFDHRNPATWSPAKEQLVADGVKIIAPPLWMLLEIENGEIVPSRYAKAAREAGLEMITWTFERDNPLTNGGAWYFQTLNGRNPNPVDPGANNVNGVNNDSDIDIYVVLHVLAQDVGILGIFSDWPATVTYYANCMNLK